MEQLINRAEEVYPLNWSKGIKRKEPGNDIKNLGVEHLEELEQSWKAACQLQDKKYRRYNRANTKLSHQRYCEAVVARRAAFNALQAAIKEASNGTT